MVDLSSSKERDGLTFDSLKPEPLHEGSDFFIPIDGTMIDLFFLSM